MKPLVSVIIPAYNRANKISTALRSVQAQTYPHWEAIVVDDGSTDKTCDVVLEMAGRDERIHLVRHQENRKAQAARNTGIRSAKGEWVAFLDSDDEYLPDSLQRRLEVADKEQVQVVHSECFIIKPGEDKKLYGIRPLSGQIYKEVLKKEGPVFPSFLIKKSALEQIGLLDEQIVAYQEWDTSIRLAKLFPFGFYQKPTFIYDYRPADAMSRNHLQNAQGYLQNFNKHFLEIWKHTGASGLAYHYEKIGDWYKKGADERNARRYARCARSWKMVSPTIILRKTKSVLAEKLRNKGPFNVI